MKGTSDQRPKAEYAALAIASILAIILLMYRAASEGLMELGDGVNHYLIARYAPEHPLMFMDLWGKPLFTLLASPFAQAGHAGVAAFNVLVAAVTAWVAIRGLRHVGGAAQLAFPILAMLAPQYVMTVLAGMTEPLFGLLTVLTVVLLLNEKPTLAAMVASLTPFARPEYVAFIPVVMVWLALDKQWRSIPWALLGLVVYALVALELFGDPLRFWASDPYSWAGDVYGSGPWDFFVSHAEEVYGRPLLVLGIIALVLWPLLYRFDKGVHREHRVMLLVAALPVLGIVMVHSVLWWKGWRGSAGLLRVLATTVPLAALFTSHTLGRGAVLVFHRVRVKGAIAGALLVALTAWCINDLSLNVDLPVRSGSDQQILEQAARGVKDHYQEGERVFSTHPFMAFGAELDPFDQSVYNPLWGLSPEDVEQRFMPGDLILWDAQLGPNESHIPLERLLNDERFAILEVHEPRFGSRRMGGHVYELILFERRDVKRWCEVDTFILEGEWIKPLTARVDTVVCEPTGSGRWCLGEGEFPFELADLPIPSMDRTYDEWSISGEVHMDAGQAINIVLTQDVHGEGIRYDEEVLSQGGFHFIRRVPRNPAEIDMKIYFWNIGKQTFALEKVTVLRKRWYQTPR
jgi:hypothetical protein